jgi:hypothetical protein
MSVPQRPLAILGLAGGVVCAGASYAASGGAASPGLAAWLQVAAITLLVHATLALAARGRAARWGRRVASTCLAGGFASALLVPADARPMLGVPLGSALMMVLAGLVPLVVLPLCFAWGYEPPDAGVQTGLPLEPDQEPTRAHPPRGHGAHHERPA